MLQIHKSVVVYIKFWRHLCSPYYYKYFFPSLFVGSRSIQLSLCIESLKSSVSSFPAINSDRTFASSSKLLTEMNDKITKDESADKLRKEIEFEELVHLLERKEALLIDVRNPEELQESGKIPNSINIPLTDLKSTLQFGEEAFQKIFQVPKPHYDSRTLILCGQGPNQGITALEIAYKVGFRKARYYIGGYTDWAEKTGKSIN